MRARIIQESELGARVLFALSTYRLMCRIFRGFYSFLRGNSPKRESRGTLVYGFFTLAACPCFAWTKVKVVSNTIATPIPIYWL